MVELMDHQLDSMKVAKMVVQLEPMKVEMMD